MRLFYRVIRLAGKAFTSPLTISPHWEIPETLTSQPIVSILVRTPEVVEVFTEGKLQTARDFLDHTIEVYPYPDGLPKKKLRQAIDYIQAHLTENVSLDAMSTEVGISRFYFCRLFKQSTGTTPYQYLIKCRIERAKALLLQEKLSIADVALEVGFSNQSHLTKHFKRLVGVTPKKFLGDRNIISKMARS